MERISIIVNKKWHQKTQELVDELIDIIPGLKKDLEAEIVIKITEDVGPQFITFQTKKQQIVFKVINFRSRNDMGIQRSIKKEESQLMLKNFSSETGMRIAEFFMDVFPNNMSSKQFIGFSVHKDFIFFRMYRIGVRKDGPAMENIGPHLTLRLWRIIDYLENGEKKVHGFQKYIKNANIL